MTVRRDPMPRVVVVGDVMLDCYRSGQARRLSPEAPVPVLSQQGARSVAGGAANVAANLAALGADVVLVGVVGDDEEGRRLAEILAARGSIDLAHLLVVPGRPTTTKTRFLAGGVQLLRLDNEEAGPLDGRTIAALSERAATVARTADVVVVSDYAKGVCADDVLQALFAAARARAIPVLVDPKRTDLRIYRGATLLKPNTRELAAATRLACDDDAQVERAARRAAAETGADLLVTRSERGMTYFRPGEAPLHLQTAAREVFDVSGAGDTVMAVVALAIARSLPMAEAMRRANVAAGLVVARSGTAVVSADELDAALGATPRSAPREGAPLLDWRAAAELRAQWRHQGLGVGFTNGCFDLLHAGHVALLERAAALCDRLVVGLNSDRSVTQIKGPSRPVQDAQTRARVLAAIRHVDLVCVFEEPTPLPLIETVRPDHLIKGADYQEHEIVGAELVRALGGCVHRIPLLDGHSTSATIRRIGADIGAHAIDSNRATRHGDERRG